MINHMRQIIRDCPVIVHFAANILTESAITVRQEPSPWRLAGCHVIHMFTLPGGCVRKRSRTCDQRDCSTESVLFGPSARKRHKSAKMGLIFPDVVFDRTRRGSGGASRCTGKPLVRTAGPGVEVVHMK